MTIMLHATTCMGVIDMISSIRRETKILHVLLNQELTILINHVRSKDGWTYLCEERGVQTRRKYIKSPIM